MAIERINEVVSELKNVSVDAAESFGVYSTEQLNWKPSKDTWSIGQCIDHLILSNTMFFPQFEKIAAGGRQNSFWENWSPFSGMGGRFLVKAVSTDSKKAKAPAKQMVPPSEIEGGIIERFQQHIDEVIRLTEACAAADLQKTVVTSPFLAVFTYKLDDAYTILVEHVKRHVRQAKRVTQAEGFPAAAER